MLFHGLPHMNRYLSYGPRSSVPEPNGKVASDVAEASSSTRNHTARGFLDRVILYPVPHSYFSHFYIASVLSSLIWGFQILNKGSLLRFVSQNSTSESSAAMSREQIVLVWSLVTIQGLRRLWETVTLTKSFVSTMPVAHYVVGILYYLALGVGIWIEGTRACNDQNEQFLCLHISSSYNSIHKVAIRLFQFLSAFHPYNIDPANLHICKRCTE
jgi:3-oxo-5-alpha-steroid 4-dehydrogenase 3